MKRGKDPALPVEHRTSSTANQALRLHVLAYNAATQEHNRSALPVNQLCNEFILLSAGQKQSALLAAASLFHTHIHTT